MTAVTLPLPYTWNQAAAAECVSCAVPGLYAYKLKQAGLPLFEPSRAFHRYNCLVYDAQPAIRAGQHPKLRDTGTSATTGMAVLKAQGLCSELTWPHTKRFDVQPSMSAYSEAFRHRITGATPVTQRYDSSGLYPLDDFRRLIDGGEAFVLSFILGDDGRLHVDAGNSLVVQDPIVWRGQVNHCVIVAGYDDGRVSEKGDKGALLCHNSFQLNGKWDFWIPFSLATNPRCCFDGWAIDAIWDTDAEFARWKAERARLGLPLW